MPFLILFVLFTMFMSTAYADEKDQVKKINTERQLELDSLERMSQKFSGESKARVLLKLSSLYRQYDYQKSKEAAQKAYDITKDIVSIEGQQIAINFLGLNEKAHGHFDLGLVYARRSMALSKFQADPCKASISGMELAEALKEVGVIDSAIYYYKQVIRNENGCQDLRAGVNNGIAYFNLGNLYKGMGDDENALKCFSSAVPLSDAANRLNVSGAALRECGLAAMKLYEYTKAISFIQRGIEKLQKTDDLINLGVAYSSLALLYSHLDTRDDLVEYYFRLALKCYRPLDYQGAKISQLDVLTALSSHFFNRHERDSSSKYALMAIKLCTEHPDILKGARISRLIGTGYLHSGELETSVDVLNEALSIARENNDMEEVVLCLENMSEVYFEMMKYDRWESTLMEIYKLTDPTEFRYLRYRYDIDENFSSGYEKLGNYELAIQYLKEHRKNQDSIDFHSERGKVSAFGELMETRKKLDDREEKLSQVLVEKKEWKRKAALSAIIASLVIILSIVSVLYWRQRNRLRHLRGIHADEGTQNELKAAAEKLEFLNKDLKSKALELTTTSLKVLQRDELLESLENDLNSLSKKEVVSPKEVERLKKQISLVNLAGRSWETFAQHHDELHEGFLSKLREAFPQLSDQDLRLLAVVRLGLSNKEIAGLLNIQPESVRKYKYRLKQKMDGDSQASIEDILAKI